MRGLQQSAGNAIGSPRDLSTVNTYYPVITMRLKSTHLDAIVIPTALSLLGYTNNANYLWKLIEGGTTANGSWTNVSSDSAVEYNIGATTITGGRTVASGFLNGSAQGAAPINVLKEALFRFQLERNVLTSTASELTLAIASDSAGADVYAVADWEEVSR